MALWTPCRFEADTTGGMSAIEVKLKPQSWTGQGTMSLSPQLFKNLSQYKHRLFIVQTLLTSRKQANWNKTVKCDAAKGAKKEEGLNQIRTVA